MEDCARVLLLLTLVHTLLYLVEGQDIHRRSSLLIAPFSQADPLVVLYLPARQTGKHCQAINATLTHVLSEKQEKLNCPRQQRNWLVWWCSKSRPRDGDLKLTLVSKSPRCLNSPLSTVVLNHSEVGHADFHECRQTDGGNSIRLSAVPGRRKHKMKITLEKPENKTVFVMVWVVSEGKVITKSIKKETLGRKMTVRLPPSAHQQRHRVVALARTASGEIIATSAVMTSKDGRLKFKSESECSKHSLKGVLEAAGGKLVVSSPDVNQPDKKPSPAPEPETTTHAGSVATTSAAAFPSGESQKDGRYTCSPCSGFSYLDRLRNHPFLNEKAANLILSCTHTIPSLGQQEPPPPAKKQDMLETVMTEAVRRMVVSPEDKGTGAKDLCGNLNRELLFSDAPISSRSKVVMALCQHCKEIQDEVDKLRDWVEENVGKEKVSVSPRDDDVIDAYVALDRCSEVEKDVKPHNPTPLAKMTSLSPSSAAKRDFLLAGREAALRRSLSVVELHCDDRKWESVVDLTVLQAAFTLGAKLRRDCPEPRHCACLAKRVQDVGPNATWEERLQATWAARSFVQWVQQQQWKLNLTLPDLHYSLDFRPSLQTNITSNVPTSPSTPSPSPSTPSPSPSTPSPSPSSSPSTCLQTSSSGFVCPTITVTKKSKFQTYEIRMEITSWGQLLDFVTMTFPGSDTPEPQNVANWSASGDLVQFKNVQNITVITSKFSNNRQIYDIPFLLATDPRTNASCVQSFDFGFGTAKLSQVCTRDEACCCDAIKQHSCFEKINFTDLHAHPDMNWIHVRRINETKENNVRIWNFDVLNVTALNDFGVKEGDVIQYVATAFCRGDFNWTLNYTLLAMQPLGFCSVSDDSRCSYLFHSGTLVSHEPSNARKHIDREAEDKKVSPLKSGQSARSSTASPLHMSLLLLLVATACLTLDLCCWQPLPY